MTTQKRNDVNNMTKRKMYDVRYMKQRVFHDRKILSLYLFSTWLRNALMVC